MSGDAPLAWLPGSADERQPPRTRLRRTVLYLPASNPRAIAKARTLAADVVILDLEDAVAPEAKADARAAAVSAVREGGFGDSEVVIRVNGYDSPWWAPDFHAVVEAKPDAVLVPKISKIAELEAYVRGADGIPVWAMIETAAALTRLDAIAAVPGLNGLVMGTNDLAKELGMKPGADRLPLHGFLAAMVLAARVHGLIALDGVWNAIDDADGFVAECAQAVRFGFDGKTLIHPSQIDPCAAAFRASPEEIAAARAIVAAFAAPEAAGKGVIRLNGQMVEWLHLEQAKALLARDG